MVKYAVFLALALAVVAGVHAAVDETGMVLHYPFTSAYTNSTAVLDRGPFGLHVTQIYGNASFISADSSMAFDGTGDGLRTAFDSRFNTTSVTFSFWANFSDSADTTIMGRYDYRMGVVLRSTENSPDTQFSNGSATIRCRWYDGCNNAQNSIGGNNAWRHITVTFDNTAKRYIYYVDGVARSNNTYAGTLWQNLDDLYIWGVGGYYFSPAGRFSNFRVYNRSLSSAEVGALYSEGRLYASEPAPAAVGAAINANFSNSPRTINDSFHSMNFGYAWLSDRINVNPGVSTPNNYTETLERLLERNVKDIRLDVHSELSTSATSFKNNSGTTKESIQAHIDTVRRAYQNGIRVTIIIYPPSWLYPSGPCTSGVRTASNNATWQLFVKNYLDIVTQNGTYKGHIDLNTNEPDLFWCLNIAEGSTQWNQLYVDMVEHMMRGANASAAGPFGRNEASGFVGPDTCEGCLWTESVRTSIFRASVGNLSHWMRAASLHPYPTITGDPATEQVGDAYPDLFIHSRLRTLSNACEDVGWAGCPIRITETGLNDARAAGIAPVQRNDPKFAYTQYFGIAHACLYYEGGQCVGVTYYNAYDVGPTGPGGYQYPRDWEIIRPKSFGEYYNAAFNFSLDFGRGHVSGHNLYNYSTNKSTVKAIVSGNESMKTLTVMNYDIDTPVVVNVSTNGIEGLNWTNWRNGTVYDASSGSFLLFLDRNETASMYAEFEYTPPPPDYSAALLDKSGLGNNLNSTTSGEYNPSGNFYTFNPGSGTVISTNNTLPITDTREMTFSVWVYANSTNQPLRNRPLAGGAWFGGSNNNQFYLNREANSSSWGAAIPANNGSGTTCSVGSISMTAGTWNHVLAKRNHSQLDLYVNGVLVATDTSCANDTVRYDRPLFIGGSSYTANRFNGSVADVRLWNRTLTSEEATLVYNNQSVRCGLIAEYDFDWETSPGSPGVCSAEYPSSLLDKSLQGRDLTDFGGTFDPGSSSYSFNGAGNQYLLGAASNVLMPNNSSFTVSATFSVAGFGASSNSGRVLQFQRTGSLGSTAFNIGTGSSNRVQVQAYNGTAFNNVISVVSATATTYTVTVTYDGVLWRAWINGAGVGNSTQPFVGFGSGAMVVGSSGVSATFNGTVYEARVWNRSLSEEEVLSYQAGFDNRCGLAADYDFDAYSAGSAPYCPPVPVPGATVYASFDLSSFVKTQPRNWLGANDHNRFTGYPTYIRSTGVSYDSVSDVEYHRALWLSTFPDGGTSRGDAYLSSVTEGVVNRRLRSELNVYSVGFGVDNGTTDLNGWLRYSDSAVENLYSIYINNSVVVLNNTPGTVFNGLQQALVPGLFSTGETVYLNSTGSGDGYLQIATAQRVVLCSVPVGSSGSCVLGSEASGSLRLRMVVEPGQLAVFDDVGVFRDNGRQPFLFTSAPNNAFDNMAALRSKLSWAKNVSSKVTISLNHMTAQTGFLQQVCLSDFRGCPTADIADEADLRFQFLMSATNNCEYAEAVRSVEDGNEFDLQQYFFDDWLGDRDDPFVIKSYLDIANATAQAIDAFNLACSSEVVFQCGALASIATDEGVAMAEACVDNFPDAVLSTHRYPSTSTPGGEASSINGTLSTVDALYAGTGRGPSFEYVLGEWNVQNTDWSWENTSEGTVRASYASVLSLLTNHPRPVRFNAYQWSDWNPSVLSGASGYPRRRILVEDPAIVEAYGSYPVSESYNLSLTAATPSTATPSFGQTRTRYWNVSGLGIASAEVTVYVNRSGVPTHSFNFDLEEVLDFYSMSTSSCLADTVQFVEYVGVALFSPNSTDFGCWNGTSWVYPASDFNPIQSASAPYEVSSIIVDVDARDYGYAIITPQLEELALFARYHTSGNVLSSSVNSSSVFATGTQHFNGSRGFSVVHLGTSPADVNLSFSGGVVDSVVLSNGSVYSVVGGSVLFRDHPANETIYGWMVLSASDTPAMVFNSSSADNDSFSLEVSFDLPVNASIKWGSTSALGSEVLNNEYLLNHSLLIEGLSPSTSYFANLTACTPEGSCVVYELFFATTNLPPLVWRSSPVEFSLSVAENSTTTLTVEVSSPAGWDLFVEWFVDGASRFWEWVTGGSGESSFDFEANYTSSGQYNVTVVVTDELNSSSSVSWSIAVEDSFPVPDAPRSLLPNGGDVEYELALFCDLGFEPVRPAFFDFSVSVNGSSPQEVAGVYSEGLMVWDSSPYPYGSNFSFGCRVRTPAGDSNWTYSANFTRVDKNHFYLFTVDKSADYRAMKPYTLGYRFEADNAVGATLHVGFVDCNGDGVWDYTFDYREENLTRARETFACINARGNFNTVVGMALYKNNTASWESLGCSGLSRDATVCAVYKTYQVVVS